MSLIAPVSANSPSASTKSTSAKIPIIGEKTKYTDLKEKYDGFVSKIKNNPNKPVGVIAGSALFISAIALFALKKNVFLDLRAAFVKQNMDKIFKKADLISAQSKEEYIAAEYIIKNASTNAYKNSNEIIFENLENTVLKANIQNDGKIVESIIFDSKTSLITDIQKNPVTKENGNVKIPIWYRYSKGKLCGYSSGYNKDICGKQKHGEIYNFKDEKICSWGKLYVEDCDGTKNIQEAARFDSDDIFAWTKCFESDFDNVHNADIKFIFKNGVVESYSKEGIMYQRSNKGFEEAGFDFFDNFIL